MQLRVFRSRLPEIQIARGGSWTDFSCLYLGNEAPNCKVMKNFSMHVDVQDLHISGYPIILRHTK